MTAVMTWGVQVDDCRILHTRLGADWRVTYLAHDSGGRISCLKLNVGGGLYHVACESREHAARLLDELAGHGIHPKALQVKRIPRDDPFAHAIAAFNTSLAAGSGEDTAFEHARQIYAMEQR